MDIEQKVIEIICEQLSVEESEVTRDASFVETLNVQTRRRRRPFTRPRPAAAFARLSHRPKPDRIKSSSFHTLRRLYGH